MQDRLVSRRQVVGLALATAAGLIAAPSAAHAQAPVGKAPAAAGPAGKMAGRLSPGAVLDDLLAGNRRFASGQTESPRRRPEDFAALAEGQSPEAVIVSCADSRVAPEILFDQGVGDLFVVRVAGNVVAPGSVIVKGSIEYAVAELHVPLIVVLGHTECGAVKAALQHLVAKDALPGAIAGLVNAIKPAVATVAGKPGDALDNAIRANVLATVARLRALQPIVAPAVKRGTVKVIGGVYDLATGTVAMLG